MLNIPEAIKERFRQDGTLKNIRVSFPNNEYPDICNDQLITESVQFKESISSRANIKIGLCENSMISFTAVNIPDITGLKIKVEVEIDASGLSVMGIRAPMDWPADSNVEQVYPVPYGVFVVSKCELDGDMRKRKVTAYSKLLEDSTAWPAHLRYKIDNPTMVTPADEWTLHLFNFIVGVNRGIFSPDMFTLAPLVVSGSSVERDLGPALSFVYRPPGVIQQCTLQAVAVKSAYLSVGVYESFGEALYCIGGSDIRFKTIYKTIVREIFPDLEQEFPGVDFTPYKNILWSIIHWHDDYAARRGTLGFLEKGDFFTDAVSDHFKIPRIIKFKVEEHYSGSSSVIWESDEYTICDLSDLEIYSATTDIPDYTITATANEVEYAGTTRRSFLEYFSKLDIKKCLEACCELYGKFGGTGRDGFFRFYDLSISSLYPSEILIPADNLYPASEANQAILEKSTFISAWHEETYYGVDTLVCDYNDGDANIKYVESIGNGKAKYDVSQNMIIKGNTYQTAGLLQALSGLRDTLQKLRYYPAELSLVGLPYVECGDELIVYAVDGTIATFCLDRTLKGIQSLRDKISAKGDLTTSRDVVSGALLEEDIEVPDELEEDEARTPVVNGTLKYNGKVQMPEWLYFDRQKMDISGEIIGQDVDTYTVTFTLKDGFVWFGTRTDEDRDVTWTIEKGDFHLLLSVDKILLNKLVPEMLVEVIECVPEMTAVSVLDTTLAERSIEGDDIRVYNVHERSGDTYLSITAAATDNYNGGTIYTPINCRFVMKVPIPEVAEQLVYTGEEQSPVWEGYDPAIMTVSGQETATNAGNYSTTFSLAPGYRWIGGGTSPKTINWSIEKADMSIVLSANSVTLDSSHTSVTLNIESVSGTLFGVFSGDTTLATVIYTENSITVSSPSGISGDTAMTISVNESDNYKAGYVDIPIYCQFSVVTGVSGIGYGKVVMSVGNEGAEDNFGYSFDNTDMYTRHLVLLMAGNLSTLTWNATLLKNGSAVTLKTFIENATAGIGVKFAVVQGAANGGISGQITQSGISSIATNMAIAAQINYTFDDVTLVEAFEWLGGDGTSTPIEDVAISEQGFYMAYFFAQRQGSDGSDAVRVYWSTCQLNGEDIDWTIGWSASSEKTIDFGIAIVPAKSGDIISISARSQTAIGQRIIYGVMKLT